MYLLKSHVKEHTRKTASGGVAVVREHEDKRTRTGADLAAHVAKQIRSHFEPSYVPKKQYHVTVEANGRTLHFIGVKEKIGAPINLSRLAGDRVMVYSLPDGRTELKEKGSRFANDYEKENFGKIIGPLQKSHVKEHTRTSKTGKVAIVHDYDDKRSKRAAESRQADIPTQLQGLPPSLREKCRRVEPGKGHEITLLKIEAAYLLKKGVFGLISAGRNPASALDRHLTDEDIDRRYQDLQGDLKDKGLKWVKVRGNYDGEEDSMMVLNPDIHREELVELGAKYNQDSVIFTDHGKNELIYTTGEHKGERNEGSGFQETPDADNYYTDLKTVKGHIKFSLNFDFDKFVKALKMGLYLLHR
jgi:hypothetical protein